MNAHTKLKAAEATEAPLVGLDLMRAPFPANQASKRPKETKAQADQRRDDQKAGRWPPKCSVCDGYHHRNAVHLDYVGHAALTDRLLDADPLWSWEPVAMAPNGLPAFDSNGGLWIKLTVCGVTRLGYGNADGKSGGDAVKEIIGDALRNAAMRFGAALDLWHKGDLHADEPEGDATDKPRPPALVGAAKAAIDITETAAEADAWKVNNKDFLDGLKTTDPEAFDEIARHWKAHVQKIKARTPASAKAAFPGEFGDVEEAGQRLNGGAH